MRSLCVSGDDAENAAERASSARPDPSVAVSERRVGGTRAMASCLAKMTETKRTGSPSGPRLRNEAANGELPPGLSEGREGT